MTNILIACEESQIIATKFKEKGFNVFSCDLQEPSGKRYDIHIKGDCTNLFNTNIIIKTMDNNDHYIDKWDLIIAHPPCTYLSKTGSRWLYVGGKLNQERYCKLLEAQKFFMKCYNAPCNYLCVENPTPLKIANLPKPTQVIQPYMFGHNVSKRTCLWLKNLPLLKPTKIVESIGSFAQYIAHDSKSRSKTFTGIAQAIVDQWSEIIERG